MTEAASRPKDELRNLYRSTLPEIYGYLLLHSGGNQTLAEDLTAETYLQATRQFGRGRGTEVTIAWLKAVAKRRLIDHWRRQGALSRKALRLRNEVVVAARVAEDDAEVEIDQQAVYDALNELDPDQRLALVLKHLDGLPVRDIAEILGRTPKATESLLGRARASFRAIYRGPHDG